MAPETNCNVRLLNALVDPDDAEDGDYRFLVDEKLVKYVTVAPGTLPHDDRTFAPILIPLLPPFPSGSWNEGHVARDADTGTPVFARTAAVELPGVKNLWHGERLDHLQFTYVERLKSNVHRVTHPRFEGTVVLKFAAFLWEVGYLEAETAAYFSIEGDSIGPDFQGHLLEGDRVIGFVLEDVGGRTAGPGDLQACRAALGRLHAVGMTHGDINRHNFLVKPCGGVAMIDFETVRKVGREECEEEMGRLEAALGDDSGRGGVYVVDD